MLISPAFAQAASGGGAGPLAMAQQFLPLILIFAVFYLLLIRPQQKRMKEHKNKLASIRRGDRVLTGGGIIATVVKVADDELTVDLTEGVRVKVMRSTVSDVLAKTDPVKGGKDDKDDDGKGHDNGSSEESKPSGLKGLLSKK